MSSILADRHQEDYVDDCDMQAYLDGFGPDCGASTPMTSTEAIVMMFVFFFVTLASFAALRDTIIKLRKKIDTPSDERDSLVFSFIGIVWWGCCAVVGMGTFVMFGMSLL